MRNIIVTQFMGVLEAPEKWSFLYWNVRKHQTVFETAKIGHSGLSPILR